MSAFFYGDIKTDELRIHGHGDNTAGQIELYDATSSNLIILKAPSTISSSNITLTLPSSLSGGANTLLTNTSSDGQLGFVTPGGDISLGGSGTFTINGISNTATITSTANLTLATGKQLNLGTAGNIGYDSANTNIIISGSNQVITRINGQQVLSATYTASNSVINLGSTSGESGYGFKNTATGQVQVKPNSSSSWADIVTNLSNCGDVTISNLANNNALLYNSGTGKWFNSQFDGALGYYGSFYDTTIQTNAGLTSANPMRFNTTAEAHGISVVNNSNITVSHAGVYNIQFSAQLENLSSGTHDVNIWLTKNGVNESNTDTKVTLVGNNAKAVAAWNFVLTLNADDYIILYWSCTDSTHVQLTAEGPSSNPTRPAIPSIILTVTQVINIQDSTLRLGDLLNVNDTGKASNSLIQYNSALSEWQAVSNITLDTGNKISFGSNNSNITSPTNGNLTIQSTNIDLVVPNGNEVHVHNNLRVTGTLYMDGNNTSNISAPTASNLDLNAGNVNIIATSQIVNRVAGQTIYTANYVGSNAIINLGTTSGESGYGFKNTATGQVQVKPNSSSSWTNLVTNLSNCGDVTISSPANTNALIYNSGTSSWINRQIVLNDISQVSVSGQTSNQALFYNGTNFVNRSPLYTDLTGNVTVLPFLDSNVRISAGAGVGGQTQRCIAIGHSAGAGGQAAGAIAIGWLAGTAGQGVRSIAIGTAAQSIGSQPNYSMVLSASSSSVNALQDNSTYIAPLRNVDTSHYTMYNPSTCELSYFAKPTKEIYTISMWGDLSSTYASSSTLKQLFTLSSTYWATIPSTGASSLLLYPSPTTWYNTSNGVIELTSTKTYYVDIAVQMCTNYTTTALIVMELVQNPITDNTIIGTMKVGASSSVDFVQFTLPMKTVITGCSNIRVNVYNSTGTSTAVDVPTDCEIAMSITEL